jgi:lipid-A-disaccharide synthase
MQFVLGEAPSLEKSIYDEILAGVSIPLKRLREGISPSMGICDLAVVASGTATLEMALIGVPMIIVYRVSGFTYLLGRLLVRVPAIGIVNLVPQKGVVPELIQGDLNEDVLEEKCLRFLTNSTYYHSVKKELAAIKGMLGGPGASERAAKVITEILASTETDGSASRLRSNTKGPSN